MRVLTGILMLLFGGLVILVEPVSRDDIESYIRAPFALGAALYENGVYSLLNSGGADAGYVFESKPLAPLPGFSGAPINMLIVLDLEGRFIDVQLIEHNEPIFVLGLGEPLSTNSSSNTGAFRSRIPSLSEPRTAMQQAGRHWSIWTGLQRRRQVVRIVHESVMGAALTVAREKMQGLATAPPAFPDPDYQEELNWQDLIDQGIATCKVYTNAQVDALFNGTLWEDDDPEPQYSPDDPYLDLWVVDVGPKAIARAALTTDSYEEVQRFMEISDNDEPILVIETVRHGPVSEDFVRNTAPDWISAEQSGLPVALRDTDLLVELADNMPDGVAMILRTDRRLGFEPSREWVLKVLAVREHGMFQPETGSVTLDGAHISPERFFDRPEQIVPAPPWLEAL
ncbi:hypothetical protein [Ruegeria sp. HKCCE3926]|uniref:hypothetical protein n=1 Tax=Ruegeria sp. HKCCE3926 TaxID=2794831 RepID=UPI0032AEC43A